MLLLLLFNMGKTGSGHTLSQLMFQNTWYFRNIVFVLSDWLWYFYLVWLHDFCIIDPFLWIVVQLASCVTVLSCPQFISSNTNNKQINAHSPVPDSKHHSNHTFPFDFHQTCPRTRIEWGGAIDVPRIPIWRVLLIKCNLFKAFKSQFKMRCFTEVCIPLKLPIPTHPQRLSSA